MGTRDDELLTHVIDMKGMLGEVVQKTTNIETQVIDLGAMQQEHEKRIGSLETDRTFLKRVVAPIGGLGAIAATAFAAFKGLFTP